MQAAPETFVQPLAHLEVIAPLLKERVTITQENHFQCHNDTNVLAVELNILFGSWICTTQSLSRLSSPSLSFSLSLSLFLSSLSLWFKASCSPSRNMRS